MTWQPIDTAPAGKYKTIANPKGDRQVFEPEWCFVMLNGKRYWTYRTEGGRWNGFKADQIGDAWHPAPTPLTSPGLSTRESETA